MMKSLRSTSWLFMLTLLLWALFLCGTVALFAVDMLVQMPFALSVLWLLTLILLELMLLSRYLRFVAQWRAVLLVWLLYGLARIAATAFHGWEWQLVATTAMIIAIYAILAGWFATVALSIRRDVSVAYLAIFMIIAPLVMRAAILDAGSVLAFLQGKEPGADFQPFAMSEIVVMTK